MMTKKAVQIQFPNTSRSKCYCFVKNLMQAIEKTTGKSDKQLF